MYKRPATAIIMCPRLDDYKLIKSLVGVTTFFESSKLIGLPFNVVLVVRIWPRMVDVNHFPVSTKQQWHSNHCYDYI